MTTEAKLKTDFLTYSHTIGLCTMQYRGFYSPTEHGVWALTGGCTPQAALWKGMCEGLRVTVYDTDSNYYGVIGRAGTGDGEFTWPTAVAVDSAEPRVCSR